MALVKKGPFFMAIKFELSLVITFMAFYEPCIILYKWRVLYFVLISVDFL